VKTTFKTAFFFLLIATMATFSCKKSANTKPKTNNLALLEGGWYSADWGGVNNNYVAFTISDTTASGTVTYSGPQSYNFNVGDKMFTNIVYNSPGTYTAQGKYTYGTDNSSTGMRAVTLSLQNNNTQLTADYPALNADFPEIIYVFQQGQITAL